MLVSTIIDRLRISTEHTGGQQAAAGPDDIGYVLLPTRKQHDYVAKMRTEAGKRGRKLQPDVMDLPLTEHSNWTRDTHNKEHACFEALTPVFENKSIPNAPHFRLVRCWRLLDSTHIASVTWYVKRVYNSGACLIITCSTL